MTQTMVFRKLHFICSWHRLKHPFMILSHTLLERTLKYWKWTANSANKTLHISSWNKELQSEYLVTHAYRCPWLGYRADRCKCFVMYAYKAPQALELQFWSLLLPFDSFWSLLVPLVPFDHHHCVRHSLHGIEKVYSINCKKLQDYYMWRSKVLHHIHDGWWPETAWPPTSSRSWTSCHHFHEWQRCFVDLQSPTGRIAMSHVELIWRMTSNDKQWQAGRCKIDGLRVDLLGPW